MIVWLASWPRSGNTFLRVAVHAAFGVATHTVYDDDDPVAQRIGPELVGYEPLPRPADELAAHPEPWFIKTHRLRPDRNPAIVVVRDGRDAITSYGHLRAAQTVDPREGAAYQRAYERAVEAQLDRTDDATATWGRNVLSWVDGDHPARVVVRYDQLVADPSFAIEAVGQLVPDLAPGPAPVIPAFDQLHARDPGFFRRGTSGSHRDELPSRLEARFWADPSNARAMELLAFER